jgi:hypothetical protein
MIESKTIVGIGTPGVIWSLAEAAVAVISACLPNYGPLFTKHKQDPYAHHISRDLTVTVTSGRVPPRGIRLSDRSTTYKAWTGNKAPSHGNDPVEGPFVRLEGSDGASMEDISFR